MVWLISMLDSTIIEGVTYVLGVFVAALRVLDDPPEMAGKVDGSALVGLLE